MTADDINLDALVALADAATPGPWYDGEDASVRAELDAYALAVTPDPADAAFIAAADPTTVKHLVQRVKDAETERDHLSELFDVSQGDWNVEYEKGKALRAAITVLADKMRQWAKESVYDRGLSQAIEAELRALLLGENTPKPG